MPKSTEVEASLVNLSRPQVGALLWLHQYGAAERRRDRFAIVGSDQQHHASTITALATRGLAKIKFAAGRHRAVLTEKGQWYARSAVRQWSPLVARKVPADIMMAG